MSSYVKIEVSELENEEAIERLQIKLAQASAMLNIIYGAGGDSFDLYGKATRDNYL